MRRRRLRDDLEVMSIEAAATLDAVSGEVQLAPFTADDEVSWLELFSVDRAALVSGHSVVGGASR